MESDADQMFRRFIKQYGRDDIAGEAERVLKEKASTGGSLSVFRDFPGGLIGFVIRRLILTETATSSPLEADDLVIRLVEFYAFPEDWVPPRFLVREALAHAIQLHHLSEWLRRELNSQADAGKVLQSYSTQLSSPQNAFLLTDEQTDDIIQRLRIDLSLAEHRDGVPPP